MDIYTDVNHSRGFTIDELNSVVASYAMIPSGNLHDDAYAIVQILAKKGIHFRSFHRQIQLQDDESVIFVAKKLRKKKFYYNQLFTSHQGN